MSDQNNLTDLPDSTINPARAALIEMADPNRLKSNVIKKLDEIKKTIQTGGSIQDNVWDALIEISDLYADVVAYREEEKAAKAAEKAEKEAKAKAEAEAKAAAAAEEKAKAKAAKANKQNA
ncbi:hypothetical protein D3C73_840230 [compost metagenome]